MKEFSLCLLLTICFSISAFCQLEPVSWNVDTEVSPEEVTIKYTATIDEGWYVYSQYLESDLGPIPTSINFDTEGIEMIGKVEEMGDKKEGYDKLFEMNISKYSKTLTLVQKLKRTDDLKNIKGYIEFMTCDNNRCLPPTSVDFDIKVN